MSAPADLVIIGVEILEIACAGVHGADAETNPAVIEQIEIDKRKQRFRSALVS